MSGSDSRSGLPKKFILYIDLRNIFGFNQLMLRIPHHSRKYTLNEDLFSNWSSEMAYIIGFWFADGYMRKEKSYRVNFSSNDNEILEKIKIVLGSNAKIYRYFSLGILQNYFALTFHSKKLFLALKAIGGQRNKSRTLKFPNIPVQFLADFIRGYFDGDGSVHYINFISSKNGKLYKLIRCNFTCGSKDFLEQVRTTLNQNISLNFKKIGQYGPHQFKLGYGMADTRKLLNWIYYPGHTISLDRKAKFVDIINKIKIQVHKLSA